jgi:hypothetical protein
MVHCVAHLLKPADVSEITAIAADLVPSPTAVGEGWALKRIPEPLSWD